MQHILKVNVAGIESPLLPNMSTVREGYCHWWIQDAEPAARLPVRTKFFLFHQKCVAFPSQRSLNVPLIVFFFNDEHLENSFLQLFIQIS